MVPLKTILIDIWINIDIILKMILTEMTVGVLMLLLMY